MGLLEQAHQKKQSHMQREVKEEPFIEEKQNTQDIPSGSGLLAKAKQKQQKPSLSSKNKDFAKNTEIVEEKKGFGWKGLGTRRIIQHNETGEHFYQVIEPELTSFETELKKEITHLFKMLADIDVTGTETKERKKYLKKTLEKIVSDNDIKFYPTKKNTEKTEEKKPKTFKELFQFRKPKNKSDEQKTNFLQSISIDSMKKSIQKMFDKDLKKQERERLERIAKESKNKVFYHLFKEFLGYGKIDIVMKDEGIEDISCDGPDTPIFIYHKKYDEITSNIYFDSPAELDSFVIRLAQICGKQISIFSPIVDGKLPDGSRLQSTLAKTVTRGSTFTIRRFRENPLTPVDLINFKSLSLDMAAYFWMAIENGASVLFCGGTASGKTTALNALSLFIPPSHKIISIEDTREISLPHKNWIAGTTRKGFSSSEDTKTGKDIDMFDLIRAALRQRPKVVMVGEVRGKEAYSLFQAMATGHTSYSTVHASTIHTLIQRLENPPISLPRALLTSLDIIVFQNAIDINKKTVRRMTSVTEVIKLDPDTNQLIFMEPFSWVSKTDDRFERTGGSKIMNSIRLQSDWDEEELDQELDRRKTVLKWMIKNNLRDYRDVGRIVAEYERHPDKLIKKASEELSE
ncbi:MAG: type II/IV secretion system ATPase subunit [Candidatus Thermoplasmatota archaeon]|nr:type II/IV secretion system ATPase subunit [Candidatus Thermoplasmatota archaeon]